MADNLLKHIGIRIAYFRRLKNWRQTELANAAGLSPSYIAKIEAGNKVDGVPLSSYILIAAALDVSLKKLVNIKKQ